MAKSNTSLDEIIVETNDTPEGQNFGYKWQGASVNLIADNHDKSADAVCIQIFINHPLRVTALSLSDAEKFLAELESTVKVAKRIFN